MKMQILVLVSAISMIGCSGSSPSENDVSPQCVSGIINGNDVSASDPLANRVVLLESDEMSCTATLISPNVVLTAAHCVRGSKNLRVSFGPSQGCSAAANSARVRKVIATRVHENYDDRGFGTSDLNSLKNDVALVKFRGSTPQEMIVSRIYDGHSDVDSSDLIAIGYGDAYENSTAAPRLRRVTKTLADLQPTGSEQQLILLQPNSGICTGDSGGPQFVRSRGQFQIFAVNSAVLGPIGSEFCHRQAVLMSAPYFADWIWRNLRSLR